MLKILETALIYILEPFLMLGAGLGIIGLRINIKKMLLISIIQGFLIFLIRRIYITNNIPFGTHTFILSFFFILLLVFIGKRKVLDATIAALFSLCLLLAGEGVILMPLIKALNLDIVSLINKPGMSLVLGLLSYIPLLIVFIVVYVLDISVIDINSFNKTTEM